MLGYIYKITSPSGKIYIGQTVKLEKRKKAYNTLAPEVKKQKLLYNSLQKYGFENHIFEIIDEVPYQGVNNWLLDTFEIYWIKEYKSNKSRFPDENGLNLTDGGRKGLGKDVSIETRNKMSESAKGSKKNLGVVHSKESRESQSLKMKGRKQSSETIEKRVSKLRGRKQSVEEIENRSNKLRGKKHSEEQNILFGSVMKEKYRSGEIIPWNKGKKGISEETREKMKQSRINYLLNNKLEIIK